MDRAAAVKGCEATCVADHRVWWAEHAPSAHSLAFATCHRPALAPPASFFMAEPGTESDPLADLAGRGGDASALRALLQGDAAALTEALKALGYTKIGQRKRIESALLQTAATAVDGGWQIDLFGIKRGKGIKAECLRYSPAAVNINPCAAPGGAEVLKCLLCGLDNNAHENRG